MPGPSSIGDNPFSFKTPIRARFEFMSSNDGMLNAPEAEKPSRSSKIENIAKLAIPVIQNHEGLILNKKITSVPLIGWGHQQIGKEKALNRITKEKADEYLNNDARLFAAQVSALVKNPDLKDYQIAAMTKSRL